MPAPLIHVLYATVSGNAEELSAATARRLTAAGWSVEIANLADFPAADLAGAGTALFLVSTWGDGEPPPDAAEFFVQVAAPDAPRLERLRYAVLALGSSRYPDFCGCGRRLDESLGARGARRILNRVDCDVKLKAAFENWLERVTDALGKP
ncbi:MAG TPA: flavodoxin domain-containing protein [Opitutaceae bacterium]|nr:flavodoxin domain-containing protein [Opitutaceae bacterium]